MENGMKECAHCHRRGGESPARGKTTSPVLHSSILADQAVGCTINDVYALRKSAPLIKVITPEMRTRNVTVTHRR